MKRLCETALIKFVLLVFPYSVFCLFLPLGSLVKAQENRSSIIVTEVLRLGIADDLEGTQNENEIFGDLLYINNDSIGNVYVSDSKLNNIRKFSPTGKLLWTISGRGQGPGEFRDPAGLFHKDGMLYIFDDENRRFSIFTDSHFSHASPPVPDFIFSYIVTHSDDIYASAMGFNAREVLGQNSFIHKFNRKYKKTMSFGSEIVFDPTGVRGVGRQRILYHNYAWQIYLQLWQNKILASPTFDFRTFIYSLDGHLVSTFENPEIDFDLLDYKATPRGVSFSIFDTQCGPSIAIGNDFLIKGYQVRQGSDQLIYFLDIFNATGSIIESQIPISGLVKSASSDGHFYTAGVSPHPQVIVYKLDLSTLQK